MTLERLKEILDEINKYGSNFDTKIYVGNSPVEKVKLVQDYIVVPATQTDRSHIEERLRIVILTKKDGE